MGSSSRLFATAAKYRSENEPPTGERLALHELPAKRLVDRGCLGWRLDGLIDGVTTHRAIFTTHSRPVRVRHQDSAADHSRNSSTAGCNTARLGNNPEIDEGIPE